MAVHRKQLKIVLLGAAKVGKTQICSRACTDSFNNMYVKTHHAGYYNFSREVNSQSVRLQTWDAAGSDQYLASVKNYYTDISVVLLCYDVTSRNSLDALLTYIDIAKESAGDNIKFILVGNKSDAESAPVNFETFFRRTIVIMITAFSRIFLKVSIGQLRIIFSLFKRTWQRIPIAGLQKCIERCRIQIFKSD